MNLYDECKILVAGLFPLTGFSVDGFDMILSEVDISWLDLNNESMSDLIGGEIFRNAFQAEEYPGKSFAVYLKNKTLTEREIPESLLLDKHKLLAHYRDIYTPVINNLMIKLELVLGYSIHIPSFTITVYDENHNQIGKTGGNLNQSCELSIRDYTQELKDRLVLAARIKIDMDQLSTYRKNNLQFDRALRLYISALSESDKEIRFVMLIASLEALFNPGHSHTNLEGHNSGQSANDKICSRVASYTSKILSTNSKIQRDNRDKQLSSLFSG